jgi:hypothetical protein
LIQIFFPISKSNKTIDIEEVLSFSPMFREKIRKTENDTDELASQLKKTAKQAKDVIKLSKGITLYVYKFYFYFILFYLFLLVIFIFYFIYIQD